VGYNVVKFGDRFEATRAVQNAVKNRFGSLDKESAQGVVVRSDRGSQYTSEYYVKSMDHLGIEISHTWSRSPESNGIIERFHRTIEEQLLSLHDLKRWKRPRKPFVCLSNAITENGCLRGWAIYHPKKRYMRSMWLRKKVLEKSGPEQYLVIAVPN
jgi:transposase InsO family protein